MSCITDNMLLTRWDRNTTGAQRTVPCPVPPRVVRGVRNYVTVTIMCRTSEGKGVLDCQNNTGILGVHSHHVFEQDATAN